MSPSSPWPELQPLAARIAVGELDGDQAIDAIVAAIVAREAAAAKGGADEVALRREAIAAVRGDRVLMAMLRPVAAPAMERIPARAPAVERVAASAAGRAAAHGRATREPTPAAEKVRIPGRPAGVDAIEPDESATYLRTQRTRRGTAIAGIAGGVVIGAAAWWLFIRETPCERFARQACLELAAPCSVGEVESHFDAKGIDDAKCDAVREAAQTASNESTPSKRGKAYEKAVIDGLGFDPRTGETPAAAPAEGEKAPATPVTLARGLPQLRNLAADEAYVYLGTDDAVLKLRSIGGQFETIAPARMPHDLVPTADFIYWRAQEADGSWSLWVDRKRGDYPPQAMTVAPAKPIVSRCILGLCAFVDATDGAVWTVAQDGTPAKKLSGPQTPAPGELWLDEREVAWAIPGAQGMIAAIAVEGGTPRVLAGAEADPRELLGDADALYWVAQGAVRRIARAGGDVTTLLPAGGTVLAVDSARLYVGQGPAGTIVALPREGGTPTTLVSGQTGLGRITIDGGALFWERGGELLRLPK
ncbi:MAG TPA: hypothetical protein VG755_01335 [Nannocystaceae bacterium]|nr:hypothetical protein [Nannocystaceae bacterium]